MSIGAGEGLIFKCSNAFHHLTIISQSSHLQPRNFRKAPFVMRGDSIILCDRGCSNHQNMTGKGEKSSGREKLPNGCRMLATRRGARAIFKGSTLPFAASVPCDFMMVDRLANKWGDGERLSPHATLDYLASEHRKSLPGLAPVALPFSNVTSPLHMIQRYPVGLCTSRVLLFGGISFATSGALTPSFSRS